MKKGEHRTTYTQEEIDAVKKLYDEGETSPKKLSELTGISSSTIHSWIQRKWVSIVVNGKKKVKKIYTQEEIDTVKQLYNEGNTNISTLARLSDIPASTIHCWRNNEWRPGKYGYVKKDHPEPQTELPIQTELLEPISGSAIVEAKKILSNDDFPILEKRVSLQDFRKKKDEELDSFVDKCIEVFTGYRDLKRRLSNYEAQVAKQNAQIVQLTNSIQKALKPQI